MVATDPNEDENDPRRSEGTFLSLKAFILLIVATGIGLLSVHNPLWGAGVLAAVTGLGVLATLIR